MGKAESRKPKSESWGRAPFSAPAFRFPLSALIRRKGLTLIELLVVIVILTTLVAGVIPILSPNNDTRKIREATRMLQTYIVQAQAEAARTGRPQGIVFQESSAGSGVALDVFRLEVPRPFAGFSSASRVTVTPVFSGGGKPHLYGQVSGGGNAGKNFSPKHTGNPLYDIRFVFAATAGPDPDPFPPGMFRIGDQINIEGNVFLIVDDNDKTTHPNKTRPSNSVVAANSIEYLVHSSSDPTSCILLNDTGQVISPGSKRYQIFRQPTKTAEAPMQFPAGIGIDMQGSVVEGGTTGGFPTNRSLFIPPPDPPPTPPPLNTVGIMFSPNGGVSDVLLNGNLLNNVSRIALLMGRVENGGIVPELNSSGSQIVGGPWVMPDDFQNDQQAAQVELKKLQQEINWLNLDSRWMSIVAGSGRVVVSDNAFVNAGDFVGDDVENQVTQQIEAAHEFAHQMRTAGAGR